jgi:hypothetical protein
LLAYVTEKKYNKAMKKLLVIVLITTLLTGCTGSFALTKKVYKFHHQQKDKWMDELVFLGCVILPVYGLATMGDAIIFNTAEFWTGKNPIQEANANKTLTNGDLQVLVSYSNKDDTVKIVSLKSLKPGMEFVVKRTTTGVSAEDRDGKVLFTSVTRGDGGISVYDGNKILVRHFSPMEIREVAAKFKGT